MSEAQTLEVEVTAIEQVTPLIKHFKLRPVAGESMPAFSGGSHIVVVMHAHSRVPQPLFAAESAAPSRVL